MRILHNCILSITFLCFILTILFLDSMEGFSLFMNNSYIIFCAVTILIIFSIAICFKKKKLFIYPITYVLIVLLLPFTNFTPTKPLKRSYYQFRRGMTVGEITSIVEGEFAKTSFSSPKIRQVDKDTQQFILNPNDSDYDSFWLIAYYKNNLYQRARISPD